MVRTRPAITSELDNRSSVRWRGYATSRLEIILDGDSESCHAGKTILSGGHDVDLSRLLGVPFGLPTIGNIAAVG